MDKGKVGPNHGYRKVRAALLDDGMPVNKENVGLVLRALDPVNVARRRPENGIQYVLTGILHCFVMVRKIVCSRRTTFYS